MTEITGPSHGRPPPMMLITGPSGAGRSTTIRALEDMGYEAIDNLPLGLLPRLLGAPPGQDQGLDRPLALGVDTRNRDFSPQALIDAVGALDAFKAGQAQLLYLDCRPDVLLRRFSETRRRHPLAPTESAQIGIARELDLLRAVYARADILIDTSEMSPHDLRAELERLVLPRCGGRLSVSVHSFSYKRGLPRGADIVLDCRFLRNPYWEEALRSLDGRAPEVAAFVVGDARFAAFYAHLTAMLDLLLPSFEDEGKSYLSIALGCTGGQHRSVAVTESLARTLADGGWQVSIRHRELERRATITDAP
ncbi:RNase adapter RapZ [Roseovarius sp. M141]|uniref:RNase adapter RapZ n=1 Tax=Roseovarius sp. M141 TaxID=2583806 RepID=UPI0020CEDAE0|nr:RNase adapter RapZ [Roseovarius sp. M141]MCQ0092355.1 RNase adapter RapZ [Roseovarius sp. M141]